MKKRFLSFILLGGLLSGSFCVEAKDPKPTPAQKKRWFEGLQAARKTLLYKQPLTKQEQKSYDFLKKQIKGGIAPILALLAVAKVGQELLYPTYPAYWLKEPVPSGTLRTDPFTGFDYFEKEKERRRLKAKRKARGEQWMERSREQTRQQTAARERQEQEHKKTVEGLD